MTQPSQPLPLASLGWRDKRKRGSNSSCGQLTHPIGTVTGKGVTCWMMGAGFMYACVSMCCAFVV